MPSPTLPWYRRQTANHTTTACCPGVDRDVAAFPGTEPHATPPGIPWNWTALRLDRRCPIPPGITPGLEDCPSPLSSLEYPGLGRLSARIDAAPLAWYDTRPPGFHLPRCGVRRIYSYHLVLCVSRREQFYTTWYCAYVSENSFYTTWYCAYVSENSFYTTWYCAYVSENSFYTTWYCACFQRTVFIPPGIVSAFKRTVFIPLGMLSAFQRTVFHTTSQLYVSGRSQYTRYCV